MGLSLRSALSIFCNPYDLIFFVGGVKGKHSVLISFGPAENCRPIVSTGLVFAKRDEAIGMIDKILITAIEHGGKERQGLLSDQEGPFLDQALRERILADLRSVRHQADTYVYEHP